MRCSGGVLGVVALIALGSCGPKDTPRESCRLEPTFVVILATDQGRFPEDTRLVFTHGSGTERFNFQQEHVPRVVFCETTLPLGPSGGEAGGSADAVEVEQIVCDLWTGGPTELSVFASGFEPIEGHLLETESEVCTVTETIELETEQPPKPPEP